MSKPNKKQIKRILFESAAMREELTKDAVQAFNLGHLPSPQEVADDIAVQGFVYKERMCVKIWYKKHLLLMFADPECLVQLDGTTYVKMIFVCHLATKEQRQLFSQYRDATCRRIDFAADMCSE